MVYVTHMWVWCYVQLLTLQKPHIPSSFNMYLVINKWVTAVKVWKFSGHYLRNRSTLDIGVLGYIGIVLPKEHSPEVSHIPPVTPSVWPPPQYAAKGKPALKWRSHSKYWKCRRSKYWNYRRGSKADLTLAVRNGRYVLIQLPKHPYPILLLTL
jgi:hypothetical protein